MQVGDVRFLVVVDPHQGGRELGDLRLFGDNQRDRLAVEQDPVVVERPEGRPFRRHVVLVGAVGVRHPRPVRVREHVDHAVDAQGIARVDARDPALGDGGCDDAAVGEVGRDGRRPRISPRL